MSAYYFNYFAPSMAICGQLKKLLAFYTSSLKKGARFLQQTPLLGIDKLPSPVLIAAHHIFKNYNLIIERYSSVPQHLRTVNDEMAIPAEEYRGFNKSRSAVIRVTERSYIVGFLHLDEFFDKNLLGLATGIFLNLRVKSGEPGHVGALRSCSLCLAPATQQYFLDVCPNNGSLRRL